MRREGASPRGLGKVRIPGSISLGREGGAQAEPRAHMTGRIAETAWGAALGGEQGESLLWLGARPVPKLEHCLLVIPETPPQGRLRAPQTLKQEALSPQPPGPYVLFLQLSIPPQGEGQEKGEIEGELSGLYGVPGWTHLWLNHARNLCQPWYEPWISCLDLASTCKSSSKTKLKNLSIWPTH